MTSSASAAAEGDYVDTIAIDHDVHLVLPAGTVAHYANHSCDPTLWRMAVRARHASSSRRR